MPLILLLVLVCMESCLPIGWRIDTWWKKTPKSSSFWFGLRKFFTFKPQPKGQLMSFAHLWNTVWRKRSRLALMQAVNGTCRRLHSFLHGAERLRTLNSYKIFKIKNKKIKNIYVAVDVLLKCFLMIPLSCRSNLARRYRYLLIKLSGYRTVFLKVRSGQIGSAWEWYHWKAL